MVVSIVLLLVLCLVSVGRSFVVVSRLPASSRRTRATVTLAVAARENDREKKKTTTTTKTKNSKKKKVVTLADLRDEMIKNPAKFQPEMSSKDSSKDYKYRRTRRRVENPKQRYLYASQRRAAARRRMSEPMTGDDNDRTTVATASDVRRREAVKTADDDPTSVSRSSNAGGDAAAAAAFARDEFGLMAAAQHSDPPLNDSVRPRIVGRIRVVDNNDDDEATESGSYAYIIEKPSGWSVLGAGGSGGAAIAAAGPKSKPEAVEGVKRPRSDPPKRDEYKRQIKIEEEDGSVDVLEYNELDVLALLTPEELEEYKVEMGEVHDLLPSSSKKRGLVPQNASPDDDDDDDDDDDNDSHPKGYPMQKEGEVDERTAANLRRIAARARDRHGEDNGDGRAPFVQSVARPSVVAWLKDVKAAAGTPIRGGKYWTALTGAVAVDDSGLLLLCPKDRTDNVVVDYAEYVAAVGTGGRLAPSARLKRKMGPTPQETEGPASVEIDVKSRLRKGRSDDVVHIARIRIAGGARSTCDSVVQPCQKRFLDGIRGDPTADPLDRRAARRLVHCTAMSVSSLVCDDDEDTDAEAETTTELPDDIAVLARRGGDRLLGGYYRAGSFLGRSVLRDDAKTTAYREINGEADGFPGWTVDRYDKWLLVQHDPDHPRGPLPSIHDGNTAGVYLLESRLDRSSMGSSSSSSLAGEENGRNRPFLLEGQPAPDMFPVLENGVTYLVSLNRDLSTGLFLDQRSHRAWLTRHCTERTRVLNCFAHTGAYSVAAAAAGASTVNIDLSGKWLDRFPAHLQANGINYDERHDCIRGDCFDWLARLARRGEQFDVVILDPPSSSVGGRKKKRWSVRNDMDELVALAARLVRPGGLLWTTTNSAGISVVKFARLVKRGLLEEAHGGNSTDSSCSWLFKLERVQPMPADFPCVGPQPVKNLVWRL